MTLVRVWRRQLYASYGAALIVPTAMLAALISVALGGGFSRLGVLGQIFTGPPVPSEGAPASPGESGAGVAAQAVAATVPLIPLVRSVAGRSTATRGPGSGARRLGTTGPSSRGGVATSGGAVGSGGAATRPLGGGPPHPGSGPPRPPASSPAGPSSGRAPAATSPPGPAPSPPPTPVDAVVQIVTSITSQIPGPAGSTATEVVDSAGNTVSGLAPGGSSPPPSPPAPSAPLGGLTPP